MYECDKVCVGRRRIDRENVKVRKDKEMNVKSEIVDLMKWDIHLARGVAP